MGMVMPKNYTGVDTELQYIYVDYTRCFIKVIKCHNYTLLSYNYIIDIIVDRVEDS